MVDCYGMKNEKDMKKKVRKKIIKIKLESMC